MEADYEIKQGDLTPPLDSTLTENGDPKDISSADKVVFTMSQYESDVEVSRKAQIVNASEGSVSFAWEEGDTDEPGLYFIEWEVVFPGPKTQSFPNSDYDLLYINE